MRNQYYVYIMATDNLRVLYVGVTNDLIKRRYQHKNQLGSSFTTKYKVTKLAYYEIFVDIKEAIAREKQLKGGSRLKKLNLIQKMNPQKKDLFDMIV